MTDRELDRLLDGAPGVTMTTSTGAQVHFDRKALADPAAWRAAMRRALGHTGGYEPPHYSEADHDVIIRTLFRLIDLEEAQVHEYDPDELPADPDLDDVPEELRILSGVDHGQVVVLDDDGVSREQLAVVPSVYAHARRLAGGNDCE
jgi:hypothetical protein